MKHNSVCFVILYSCPSLSEIAAQKRIHNSEDFPDKSNALHHLSYTEVETTMVFHSDITQLYFTVIYESRHAGDKAASDIYRLSQLFLMLYIFAIFCTFTIV